LAKLITVIESEEMRGNGKDDTPYRKVRQFWTVDGELLVEQDEWFSSRLRNLAEAAKVDGKENPLRHLNELVFHIQSGRYF
jgi:hypothetical protein